MQRNPEWLKVRMGGGEQYARVAQIVRNNRLHTVCRSASCPNLGECWSRGTATMMILGEVCTRGCRFCAVPEGRPAPPDPTEPVRLAEAVHQMGLRYVVITSVTRDDLPGGGAEIWADTIREVRRHNSGVTIEVLIPDFSGNWEALGRVLAEKPDVLNHNLETVPRLYPQARPQADYDRSCELLTRAHRAGLTTKTGLMLGLGESDDEVREVFSDLVRIGVDRLTLGQYLQPSRDHLEVVRYLTPAEFDAWGERARAYGLTAVESSPLVRSSYHAEAMG